MYRNVLVGSFILASITTQLMAQKKTFPQQGLGATAQASRESGHFPTQGMKREGLDPKTEQALNANAATDVNAYDEYKNAIGQLLDEERFDVLEQIAADLRSNKRRFSGGVWKLHAFYNGLDEPKDGQDWSVHFDKLERWKSREPDSITVYPALAGAYTAYAGIGRGEGYADSVTDEGWRLYAERNAKALEILQEGAKLRSKCPQWYAVMQELINADGDQAAELVNFKQAIAAEPLYYTFYRQRAIYLLPKWNGEEGDVERFADEIANQVGGAEGSIIYFEIAAEISRQCNCDTQLKGLSWPRIQAGHTAMEQKYGVSLMKLNQFARIAIQLQDAEVAAKTFEQIGNNWAQDSWGTREYFDRCRRWAEWKVASQRRMDQITSSVRANLETAEGKRYDGVIASEFQNKFASAVKQCIDAAGNNPANFDLFIQLTNDGVTKQMLPSSTTAFSDCLVPKLLFAGFPPPPKPDYWVRINMQFR
jgi:hypothetical protein